MRNADIRTPRSPFLTGLQLIFGSVLGTGYIPVAPATWASLVALPLVWYLPRTPTVYVPVLLGVYFLGVWLAFTMERRYGHDARYITIDELAGMLVTFLFAPLSVPVLIAGFFLFRFFDIVKLPWVKPAEKLPGGWGVMTDDVLAGASANVVLQVVFRVIWHAAGK